MHPEYLRFRATSRQSCCQPPKNLRLIGGRQDRGRSLVRCDYGHGRAAIRSTTGIPSRASGNRMILLRRRLNRRVLIKFRRKDLARWVHDYEPGGSSFVAPLTSTAFRRDPQNKIYSWHINERTPCANTTNATCCKHQQDVNSILIINHLSRHSEAMKNGYYRPARTSDPDRMRYWHKYTRFSLRTGPSYAGSAPEISWCFSEPNDGTSILVRITQAWREAHV
ncbi:hypothetical protein BD779DRAFT_1569705 [Infundibulicybe gibba]|nr:hypothetical protein BD779DRAFT_1569705 [Infundibulicybe gibba]